MSYLPTISNKDYYFLNSVDLYSNRLAIKTDESGNRELTSISNKEVTAWQLFLRTFGRGNLAHIDPYLNSVTSYLKQFNWKNSYDNDAVYRKVCQLANKALYHKRDLVFLIKYQMDVSRRKCSFLITDLVG